VIFQFFAAYAVSAVPLLIDLRFRLSCFFHRQGEQGQAGLLQPAPIPLAASQTPGASLLLLCPQQTPCAQPWDDARNGTAKAKRQFVLRQLAAMTAWRRISTLELSK